MDELNIEIERCGSCGTELTALNISDIEPGWCQGCTEIVIEKLHPLEEDPTVKKMSDKYLEALASGQLPCHQDWARILKEQGIEPNPIRNGMFGMRNDCKYITCGDCTNKKWCCGKATKAYYGG